MKKLSGFLAFAFTAGLWIHSTPLHAATIVVDALSDNAGFGCELRGAVTAINNQVDDPNFYCINVGGPYGTDDHIQFHPLLAGGVIPLDSEIAITRSVTIDPPPRPVTVDARENGRAFNIGSVPLSITVSISGLNVTGGNAANGAGLQVTSGDTLNLSGSAVYNNSASNLGGGFNIDGSTLNLDNVTVSANVVAVDGGGIWVANSSTVNLNNVTIALNHAENQGGGIATDLSSAIVNLTNSILDGNSSFGIFNAFVPIPDCLAGNVGSIVANFSLVSDISNCGLVGNNIIFNVPADLGPLQNNGGLTLTHALLPSSLARDSANPVTPNGTPPACETTDQRGVTRPQQGQCDMGAFELDQFVSDLSILQLADPPAVAVDELVEFNFAVTVEGPDDASIIDVRHTFNGPMVLDSMPVFCSVVPTPPLSGVVVVDCTPTVSTPGDTETYIIAVLVTGEGQIDSFATVNSGDPNVTDPNLNNNSAVASAISIEEPEQADLSVTQDADPDAAEVDADVIFNFNAANAGPEAANEVRTTHILSGPLTVDAGSLPGACDSPVVSNGTTVIQCNHGTLNSGGDTDFAISGTVTGVGQVDSLVSVADIDTGSGVTVDPDLTNNAAVASLIGSQTEPPLAEADLSLVKTVDLAIADLNDIVTFTITVENNGPSPATAVRVTDTLTGRGNFNVTSVSAGCSGTGPAPLTILCDLGTVSTELVTITVVGTVTSTGEILNHASVADLGGTIDPDPSNNSSSASTIIVPSQPAPTSGGGCSLNPQAMGGGLGGIFWMVPLLLLGLWRRRPAPLP
jgi:uncharacterized repeat protein (TIGR01451 family)